ncbi:glycosyltransferase [Microbacterium luticocti]|uniref:rhamnosyltransferase WsaF family glycosyltransferase n=1 Tax=Microbacterium luticocti TaxID=451764 RepID=UPI0003FC4B89|nr:glycosyltransferase [Microbacterium luticocti]
MTWDLLGTWRALTAKPPRELLRRAVARLGERLDVAGLGMPLRSDDIADSAAVPAGRGEWMPHPAGAAPRAAWVVIPPGPGSGGHTTLFRMMRAAQAAGFANTLVFYDPFGSDFAARAAIVRRAWPWLQCEIRPIGADLSGYDVVVASSWPTAHVVATRRLRGQPAVYFVQDFEPYFSPRGTEYALAEDSYRLGLRIIALGDMVAGCLRDQTGANCDVVPFGCDRDVYRVLRPGAPRRGVVLYARRGTDRRGYPLAVRALERFHRLRPDEPIHVYGDAPRDLPFPVIAHGGLTPAELNTLYNHAVAGIALSFTNISLVAEEMLAAGTIPVVNDSPLARADLHHPHVAWARPTAAAIATALADVVDRARADPALADTVAAQVTTASWDATGARVAEILCDELARAGRAARP